MDLKCIVRAERPDDRLVITDVVRRAYADVAYSDHREHLMIERLRGTDAFHPALSLVAAIAGEVVGHLLLTEARIRNEARCIPTLALAPLSVAPEHQGCRVGTQLVRAAHQRAAARGFESIVLVGIPSYYARFGYEPLGEYPISLPFEAPAVNRMILTLTQRALEGVSGVVDYADGWLDH